MRAFRSPFTVMVVAVLCMAAVVELAPPASASGASTIAALATANLGKKACSTNTLGGVAFGSSCTGNGGQPEFWCADFAKWVWATAGVADTSWLDPAAGSFYTYGERFGTLSAVPAVGDAAVFDYDGYGDADHVAIVTEVDSDGTIETVSGDWNGENGTETRFSSTSSVVLNAPGYLGDLGATPSVMGMAISAFVAPVGVQVFPIVGGSSLSVDHVLTSGQKLTSPNGLYSLTVMGRKTLSEYAGTRRLWSTDAVPLWGSGRHASIRLVLRDDASVLVDGSVGGAFTQRPQTESLQGGQMLLADQRIISSNGLYAVNLNSSGNLIEYTAGRVLWTTGTKGDSGDQAKIQTDGNLVVYSSGGVSLWSSHTSGHTGKITLVLEGSGNLVVRGPSGQLWANHA